MVEAASKVLQGTNLSLYGEGGQLLGQLAPLLEYLTRTLQRATQPPVEPGSGPATAQGIIAMDQR